VLASESALVSELGSVSVLGSELELELVLVLVSGLGLGLELV